MDSIKRYKIKKGTHRKKCSRDSGTHIELVEDPLGSVCKIEDVNQLRAENERLKEIFHLAEALLCCIAEFEDSTCCNESINYLDNAVTNYRKHLDELNTQEAE